MGKYGGPACTSECVCEYDSALGPVGLLNAVFKQENNILFDFR